MENKELSLPEIQQESFKVLLKLKEIMEEHNWNYCLAWGTLIGAVRHKGFIPWDDDIDIVMPRKDYEEFVQYCIDHKEELLPYSLLNSRTNEKYLYLISRFTDATNFKYVPNKAKDYGQGTFVDVYPLDECDEAEFEDNWNRLHNKYVKNMYLRATAKYCPTKTFIKNFVKWPLWNLVIRWQSHRKYQLAFEEEVKKINNECKVSSRCTFWSESKVLYYSDDFFTEKKEMEFNGVMFRVPNNYDRILKQAYGNYMKLPPENERNPHHEYKLYRINKE